MDEFKSDDQEAHAREIRAHHDAVLGSGRKEGGAEHVKGSS